MELLLISFIHTIRMLIKQFNQDDPCIEGMS
jgi:hypothetical protein